MPQYIEQPNTVYVAINPVFNVIGHYVTQTVTHYDVVVVRQEPARVEVHKMHYNNIDQIEQALAKVAKRNRLGYGQRNYENVPVETAAAVGLWNEEVVTNEAG